MEILGSGIVRIRISRGRGIISLQFFLLYWPNETLSLCLSLPILICAHTTKKTNKADRLFIFCHILDRSIITQRTEYWRRMEGNTGPATLEQTWLGVPWPQPWPNYSNKVGRSMAPCLCLRPTSRTKPEDDSRPRSWGQSSPRNFGIQLFKKRRICDKNRRICDDKV